MSSLMVSIKFIIIMATIDAKENRDARTCDIPNVFIQTDLKSMGKNEH